MGSSTRMHKTRAPLHMRVVAGAGQLCQGTRTQNDSVCCHMAVESLSKRQVVSIRWTRGRSAKASGQRRWAGPPNNAPRAPAAPLPQRRGADDAAHVARFCMRGHSHRPTRGDTCRHGSPEPPEPPAPPGDDRMQLYMHVGTAAVPGENGGKNGGRFAAGGFRSIVQTVDFWGFKNDGAARGPVHGHHDHASASRVGLVL